MLKLRTSIPLQKIMVIIFIALILLTASNSCFAISGSGSGTWENEQYNSSVKTTDNINSIYGMFMRNLINKDTGEKITVFCSEHGVDFTTGATYNAEYYKPTSSTMLQACKVAYFGWYSKYGSYSDFNTLFAHKYDYLFTQQYMWEILGQSSATFIDSSTQSQYVEFKAEIDNKINHIQTKPSFSGTTIDTEIGETITLTDTNEVLSNYTNIDKIVDGIRIIHNSGENILTLIINDDCNLETYAISEESMKALGLIKEETIDNSTTLYFLFPDKVQDQLYSMHYNEPVTLSINLNIAQFGKLELIKENSDGTLLDGAIFNVTGPDNFNEDVEISKGNIVLENLEKGTYYIKEKSAPEGYLIDKNVYEVEVEPNKISTKTIVNTPTIVEISKTDFATSEELEGAKLQLLDENENIVDEWISSKESHKISGLIEGKTYKLIEILAPDGYEKAEEITFTVSKEMQKIEMKDKPIIKENPKTGDDSNKEILIGIILFSILNLLILKMYTLKTENELINKKNQTLEK